MPAVMSLLAALLNKPKLQQKRGIFRTFSNVLATTLTRACPRVLVDPLGPGPCPVGQPVREGVENVLKQPQTQTDRDMWQESSELHVCCREWQRVYRKRE